MYPYRTRRVLRDHQQRLDGGFVILVVRLDAGRGGVDRERQPEGGQILRAGDVPIRTQGLQERIKELLVRCMVRKVAVGYTIEEGEVGRGIFLRGRLTSEVRDGTVKLARLPAYLQQL